MVKILCGLGNPGLRYENTRHNAGFDAIDRLAAKYPVVSSGRATWFEYRIVDAEGTGCILMRPLTFVNRSGLAAIEALEMFDTEPAQFFVIVDDFTIPLGQIRLKRSGSAGGHKGLISIIESLDSELFPRLRMGIGPLPDYCREDSERIPEFVLGVFSQTEREIVDKMIELGVEAVAECIGNGLEPAISKFNNRDVFPTPEQ